MQEDAISFLENLVTKVFYVHMCGAGFLGNNFQRKINNPYNYVKFKNKIKLKLKKKRTAK